MRRFHAGFFGLFAAPLLAGCPSNLCLVEVNGRCEFSTYGDGEAYDDRAKMCVCTRDRIPLGGTTA